MTTPKSVPEQRPSEEVTPDVTSGNTPKQADRKPEPRSTYDVEKDAWDRKVAKAQARAKGKTELAAAESTEATADDRRDQRKAESYRARLIDRGRALARNWRLYRLILLLLVVCLVLVIGWNARQVATGLGGENPELLDYAAEAPLSLPLLVILLLQVSAAQNGWLEKVAPFRRTHGWIGRRPTATGWIEVGLLSGSVAICTWPAISAPEPRFEEIATSALPPFSLVVASVLLYVTSDLFSEIFTEHRTVDGEATNDRRRLELAMDLALDVERAQSGNNPLPVEDGGLPSISQISKRFKGDKALAQSAHDLLVRFEERKEVTQ